MIASSLLLVVYAGFLAFMLWLAWQFVQSFARIAQSLEEIAITYRDSVRRHPPEH